MTVSSGLCFGTINPCVVLRNTRTKQYIGKYIYTKSTYSQSVAHVVKITEIFSSDGEVVFYNTKNDDFYYSREIVAFCDTEEEANNYLKKEN